MTSDDFMSDVESLDAMDAWDAPDALHEMEELADAFDAFEDEPFQDPFGADPYSADPYSADPYSDPFENDPFENDPFEDLFAQAEAQDAFEDDGFDAFEQSPTTGLFTPATAQRLVSGPAAVMLARGLNPLVMDALSADDAEAFLSSVARRMRNAARTVARGVRRVGQLGVAAVRRAAPLLSRALPLVQRVAGLAGPWGRVVAAGIGAARGLMQGQGLRGALAGAASGLIPGVGGRIASSLLRGDGMDDDASLDMLADMADARQVPAAVALPLGAGLAARMVSRHAVPNALMLGAGAQGVLRARTRGLEQQLMRVMRGLRGTPGRRLRLLRAIAALSARNLRLRGPSNALGALPRVVQGMSRQILTRAVQAPTLATVSPQVAARRVQVRQQVMRRIPVAAVSTARVRRFM
jgi:hypothetical protein